ncbi:hypothetical protein GH714_040697 [Hevea brasiliensis]|uniref:Uncharacterized protein n=1 Tax=Hevea brasiliensis TaxID=3981 RepID=A0A6A6MPW6_HEVBR|nr:hypothetical protein GH714_040697 [Hevea brasiliensis]
MGSILSSSSSKEEIQLALDKAKETSTSAPVQNLLWLLQEGQAAADPVRIKLQATLEKYQKGELLPLLNDAGAIAKNSAQL